MKHFLRFFLSLALLGTLAVAQDQSTDPVIITGEGISIRKSEFEAALKSLPEQYQQYALGPGKRQFAQDFLRMRLLAAQGLRDGLDKSPEVVAQLEMMRENLVAQAALEKAQNSLPVTDAEIQAAYEAAKGQYEKVNARHILIAFKGSPAAQSGKPELTEEQAKAKAEDLRTKLKAGASFDDLAKAESDDTGSGAQGGSLGEFGRGQMVPEFEQAAFTTPIGEISDVIRTQFGYHVLKVDSRGTSTLEEVRPQLERQEQQKKLQAYLQKLSDDAKATFNPEYFGS